MAALYTYGDEMKQRTGSKAQKASISGQRTWYIKPDGKQTWVAFGTEVPADWKEANPPAKENKVKGLERYRDINLRRTWLYRREKKFDEMTLPEKLQTVSETMVENVLATALQAAQQKADELAQNAAAEKLFISRCRYVKNLLTISTALTDLSTKFTTVDAKEAEQNASTVAFGSANLNAEAQAALTAARKALSQRGINDDDDGVDE